MCPQVAPCRAGWPPWGGWWPRSSHRAPDPVSSLAILPLMVPWCHHGATEPRCHGTKPPCCQGATVPWCHDAMVPWCHDAMVPRCHDAMVPWCHGTAWPGWWSNLAPGSHLTVSLLNRLNVILCCFNTQGSHQKIIKLLPVIFSKCFVHKV